VNLMARELRNTLIGGGAAARVARALDSAQQASDESAGKKPEAADLLFDELRPAQLAA